MTPEDTAEEMTGYLVDGAAEKVQWSRAMAREMLDHAQALRDRADQFTHLAGLMLVEAQSYAQEISDLLSAEFPTGDAFEAMVNGTEEEEDESE